MGAQVRSAAIETLGVLTQQDESLGTATVPFKQFYPFGLKTTDFRLDDTGDERKESTLSFIVKVIKPLGKHATTPEQKVAVVEETEEDRWIRAHKIVVSMENYNREKGGNVTSALETLTRLAESGIPVPQEAM